MPLSVKCLVYELVGFMMGRDTRKMQIISWVWTIALIMSIVIFLVSCVGLFLALT